MRTAICVCLRLRLKFKLLFLQKSVQCSHSLLGCCAFHLDYNKRKDKDTWLIGYY
jgi:hypothetical protein